MTPISLPHEREAFESVHQGFNLTKNKVGEYIDYYVQIRFEAYLSAWRHQQQSIDELTAFSSDLIAENAGLKNKIDMNDAINGIDIATYKGEIESLQAQLTAMDNRATGYAFDNDVMALRLGKTERQLTVAVEAMENLVKVKGRHNTEIAYKRIEEALNKINKMKAGE